MLTIQFVSQQSSSRSRADQPQDASEYVAWLDAELQRVRALTLQVVERRGTFQGKLHVKV